jgi:hypothetical protein
VRPAYWELTRRGGRRNRPGPRSPLVLGRKFCAGCGHWRHACDFALHRGRLRPRCHACTRIYQRRWRYNATPEQRERIREYDRIWQNTKRREAGIPPRNYHHRASVIDRPEHVFLPTAPLVTEIERYLIESEAAGEHSGDLGFGITGLAMRAGMQERSVRRLLIGESLHVRLDLADRLALALGLHLALIYGDTPLIYDLDPQRRAKAAA